jgi:PAS domain S-box-containing protein
MNSGTPGVAAPPDTVRALLESEARLQQVVDNTTAAVFAKDREGKYLFVNREFERLMERAASEVIGRTDREIFPPDIATRFRHNDLRVLLERQPIEFEETGVFLGEERTFLSSKFPLFDADNVPYAVCAIATDITDRKRIEGALSSAALAVSATHGDALFVELTRYLATILGVECAMIAALTHGEPASLYMLAFHAGGETRECFEYPLHGTACETVVGKGFQIYPSGVADRFPLDGDFRDLGIQSYAGFPLNDSNGAALGVISVMSCKPFDRHELIEAVLKIFAVRASAELERMQGDAALRASEESYRGIFEGSDQSIFVHDADTGAIVDVNPKACATYGFSREEMLQLNAGDLGSGVPPHTLDGAASAIEQAKRQGSARTEWHRRNKDGSLHWDEVHLSSAAIGGQHRILAFTHEITERKLAEQGLRHSEDRLRATLRAALDCIVVMDSRGVITEFNPAAQTCFGYARLDAVGRPLADLLIPARYREAHARGIERYLATGEGPFLGSRIEITALRSDGAEFPVELAVSVAEDSGGKIFIGYLRDITERKQAEQRRQRLEAQLRQAQKMEAIGQLTGGIAHDFNNLLTSIMGYVVLAIERQSSLDDARLGSYLNKAHESCERARHLIDQMLMFSRGQRGAPRPVALAPLVERALTLLEPSLPDTIRTSVRLDTDAAAVMVDPVQLEQVLVNLCFNARDALHGTGTIVVAVNDARIDGGVCSACRQAVDGAFVELRVEDDGPGMPPELLERIFEPFFSTKEVGKGAGMGLATLHGIVHEHNGHVVVDAAPGEGARFRVLFPPLVDSATQDSPPPDVVPQVYADRPALSGKVLVVDDEKSVGEFMREMLETWGLTATFVTDAREAFDIVAQAPQRFDLVITDQAMPRMKGLDLARALRSVRDGLPVVLYTGFGEQISARDLEAAGVTAMLAKPVQPQKLAAALIAALGAQTREA